MKNIRLHGASQFAPRLSLLSEVKENCYLQLCGLKESFRNRYPYGLDDLKKELLLKLGKKKDALQYSWEEYRQFPSEFTYEDLMKYVPNNTKGEWHKKAMDIAQKAPITHTIDLFLKVKEHGLLKTKIDSATHKSIESLGHYLLEPVAAVLEKHKELSTAGKVYRALGMRIINRGKSKYYDIGEYRKEEPLEEKIFYGRF